MSRCHLCPHALYHDSTAVYEERRNPAVNADVCPTLRTRTKNHPPGLTANGISEEGNPTTEGPYPGPPSPQAVHTRADLRLVHRLCQVALTTATNCAPVARTTSRATPGAATTSLTTIMIVINSNVPTTATTAV